MERLTTWRSDKRAAIANNDGSTPLQQTMKIPKVIDRLAAIEDILGDDYDLERLRELVEADRDGRCVVFKFGLGSTVYRTWVRPDGRHAFVSEEKMNTVKDLVNAELWNDAYKTSEAAEAALKRESKVPKGIDMPILNGKWIKDGWHKGG